MPELAPKVDCTGCTACASICPMQCIEMVPEKDGFFYPKINLSRCVECFLCVKSCPIKSDTPSAVHLAASAYAAYSNDLKLRKESSSGGIFSEIAIEVLKKGGVVFGAAYNAQFEISHICIETVDELYKLRGAKYAQGSLDGIFSQVLDYLKKQREVLFSGLPCQIAGLKAFLKKEYASLTCIDFVCHGVPSPAVWQKYVQYRSRLDNHGKMPVFVNMRSKESGWSHYQYSNMFDYGQKRWSCRSGDNLFMKLFVGDYINRLSCENCRTKGYYRVSDFTLGDFWGIWKIFPEMDDDQGTSLIILHSEKARQLFLDIQTRITYQAVRLEEAGFMNPSLLKASKAKGERDPFMEKAIEGAFDELEHYFQQTKDCGKIPFSRRAIRCIRRLLREK